MIKLGRAGEALIKEFESFHPKAYKDPVGIWTIGWGTTRINGIPVSEGMEANQVLLQACFLGDLSDALKSIDKLVKVPLNQNQIDALASFIYNVGEDGFFTSTLLKTINHKLLMKEDIWTRWNKGTINGKLVVLNGLTRRRKKEYKLFMTPE